MRKILITTGCDPREPWKAVLDLTVPRMEKYASLHGYDFKALWYHDVEHRYAEFHNPEPYVHGAAAYEVRKDFINWSVDRGMLAPNWIRYAAVLMLLEEYDVIVQMGTLPGDAVGNSLDLDADMEESVMGHIDTYLRQYLPRPLATKCFWEKITAYNGREASLVKREA